MWHDPFPKPSYLFALVGGNLACVEDTFVTASGREVALRLYVEPGKQDRCAWALDSLKRAMRWDEEAFGREYDLDIFMIVAVSDFNMGAMENKGLNIFNDKAVLASPETATDADFATIETIIAHEYFHNWTGDRITCRDWFQLCLKEGLTVYRDQEFTADQHSRPVKRISDVRTLRAQQFVEDAGPLAHPVRPTTYREINNFYTATVYDKGAEVVRMLKALLGPAQFRKGMDLYFERHDGHAATVDQFIQCFADATGTDLTQFMRWYSQAGTPAVTVSGSYDAQAQTYRLEVAQTVPPTPGQPVKEPMVIPLAIGLVGADGRDMSLSLEDGRAVVRGVLTLTKAAQTFTFGGVAQRPVLSLNRGFAAPVNVASDVTADDLAFLAAHDSDPFNRWQAVQSLANALLIENVAAIRAGRAPREDDGLIAALAAALADSVARARFRRAGADAAGRGRHRARHRPRCRSRRDLCGAHAPARRDRKPARTGAARDLPAHAGRRAVQPGRRERRTARAEERLPRPAGRGRGFGDRACGAAIPQRHQHDRPRGGARDAWRCTPCRSGRPRSTTSTGAMPADPLIIDKWLALQAAIPEAATLDRVRRADRRIRRSRSPIRTASGR